MPVLRVVLSGRTACPYVTAGGVVVYPMYRMLHPVSVTIRSAPAATVVSDPGVAALVPLYSRTTIAGSVSAVEALAGTVAEPSVICPPVAVHAAEEKLVSGLPTAGHAESAAEHRR